MTIDKAIKLMIRGSKYDYDGTPEEFYEAYDMSIEIMRKYQKIEQIMKKRYGRYHIEIVQEIKEVIEDGRRKEQRNDGE